MGLVQLTIPGYPRRRAPDRPWAFRRPSPPLVVYRGTPISGGLEGVPRRGSWEGRKVPDFGFSGHFRVFWVFDGLAYICPFPHIGQIRAGLDRRIWPLCASLIIFGKISPLETAFPLFGDFHVHPIIDKNHSIGHPARSGRLLRAIRKPKLTLSRVLERVKEKHL